ncbi:Uncharacterised protein [Mycobacterium tuberculosis]|uniref:Uncharacterized protein n=1 Tax=Mycobacterium tuberculosis TaxID=1773 RepID=A0A654U7N7_MYCTX|nr:Uncharacterised protein [Mycobacterium tuberculosis]CFS40137.1 Uncharacterised protein [Mycobacterium tuberculosis]COX08882.1 Uncharacterised protein [Mycobacterium tuberculosis]COZ91692.1 Uncharacterised protein [Mycobacterium tuberculosis]CPA77423.1 Uncharacterised protein [Mycobacterium tuberculosis]
MLRGCGYDMQEWVIENGGAFTWCAGDVTAGLIVEPRSRPTHFVSDLTNRFEHRPVS